MTAKEHLQSVFEISERLNQLNKMRSKIRDDLYSLGGIDYASDRVQASPDDRLLKLIAKVDEIERSIISEIEELEDRKYDILQQIDLIPNAKYKRLLFDRYILGKKWEQIAIDYDKTIRWIYRMRKKSLEEFEKVWNSH